MIEDEPEDGRGAADGYEAAPTPDSPLAQTPEVAPEPAFELPAASLLDPPETPQHAEAAPPEPEPEPVEPAPAEPAAVEEQVLPPAPPPAPEAEPLPKRRGGIGRTLRRVVVLMLVAALIGPPLSVIAYRFIPPPITWLMIERLVQGQGLTKHWTSLGDIDPSLPNAVIAAEDANFCEHHGFDFEAMQAAMRANARHPGKVRGGSTISQQVAKNVFLWPSRDYVRKGLEAYYTVLIEALWGKRRIMEMYLNEVEWGPGVYGADAAARRYFNEPASDIDPGEASRLAAILPSPLKWKAVNPGRYVRKRSSRIDAAAGTVRADGLAGCLR